MQITHLHRQEGVSDIIERISPAVLVHDAGQSFESGAIREVTRSVATLVLGPDDVGPMIEAVEAGALGYLSRESSLKDIEQSTMSVAQGMAIIPPFMLGSLLHHVVEKQRGQAAAMKQLDVLTQRESEVFRLAAVGLGK